MGIATVSSGVADTQYISIFILRCSRRNLHYDPPKLGHRPPTPGGSSFVSLTTTAAVAATTYAAVAYRSPVAAQ